MEKKYQLVAWTENSADDEKARLKMLPSLHLDVQEPYFKEISQCQQEEIRNSGSISLTLARRFVRVYEQNARFLFLTGYYGDGIRFLCMAALYCIYEDDSNWASWDTDLGNYSCFCGELRHEFVRLAEEAIALAKKHSLEHILREGRPGRMLELYLEHTQEATDLGRHLKDVSGWQ